MVVVIFAGWPRFRFIRMSVVGLAIDLGRAEGLAIAGTVLTGADIADALSGLSLW